MSWKSSKRAGVAVVPVPAIESVPVIPPAAGAGPVPVRRVSDLIKKPVILSKAQRSRRTSNYFRLPPPSVLHLPATIFSLLLAANLPASAQASASAPAPVPPAQVGGKTSAQPAPAPASDKFKAVDADNHTVFINKPGIITLLLGTSEDSQDAARAAGKAMYPIQGRSDFQLIVVVDLRDSIAAWAPSIVLDQMRANLDREAVELKPYFLKNGNKTNPRNSSFVIPDFKGTICPQLGWNNSSDDLRGILYGADGREIKRLNKIDDMDKLQADVWAAIADFDAATVAKAIATAKTQGTKLVQPPNPPLPLPPLTPTPKPG